MLKRAIKKICHKFYIIGRSEDLRLSAIARQENLNKSAVIGNKTLILETGEIYNYQNNRERIKIGSNCSIMGELCVFKHAGNLSIGDYCFVGPRSRIQSAKSIFIGNRVLIAHDVNIMDNNSHPLNASERHIDFARFLEKGLADKIDLNEKEIVIKDDVWIGFGSTILKGVTIGKGAIIGSDTVVTKDVAPYAIMVGNPARLIKYISE
jgi:acetyltransferase-like isoleucine patch superfamily enzyme